MEKSLGARGWQEELFGTKFGPPANRLEGLEREGEGEGFCRMLGRVLHPWKGLEKEWRGQGGAL